MTHPIRLRATFGALALTLLSGAITSPSLAQDHAQDITFKGRTVAINIGYGPGGGYDTYGRAFALHFGSHLPGNPTVVPRNMPGGGGIKAFNYIYNAAPKDGTELGLSSSSVAMEPMMGNKEAKFDASKFGWLGSMDQDVSFCGVWQRPGAPKSFKEILDHETIFGSAGVGAISYQHPLILKNLLGAKIKVISAFAGTRDISLAMQRGEVAATCALFTSSIKAQYINDVNDGRLKLIIQMGPKRSNVFGDIPSVYDFATTNEQKKILALNFDQILLARPIAAPPGMDPERLAVMRKAFMDTMKDPAFLADAKKYNIDIDPATGEQAEKMLKDFANYPPAIIAKAKKIIGR
ncbi:MAG TPA: tripartite tricarboxylate transporter substrate-binding protein [Xanthobacteraceae bacterium]|nr:tripartite tricarboxylate transporter substrate-binding protein [Xanthobacteraceae bacterium]